VIEKFLIVINLEEFNNVDLLYSMT